MEAGSVSFHASSCAFWSAKKSVELREGSLSRFDLFNAAFSRAGKWLLFIKMKYGFLLSLSLCFYSKKQALFLQFYANRICCKLVRNLDRIKSMAVKSFSKNDFSKNNFLTDFYNYLLAPKTTSHFTATAKNRKFSATNLTKVILRINLNVATTHSKYSLNQLRHTLIGKLKHQIGN